MRRWLKRLAWGALGLVGLLLMLALAGWLWLESSAGQAKVRQVVADAAHGAIAGQLVLGTVDLGGRRLVVNDLELRTPEGELVAKVDTVEVDADVFALLGGEVDLTRAVLRHPQLFLVQDERGLNLTRALAATSPSAPSTAPERPLHVRVQALELTDGLVDAQHDGQVEHLEGLTASGHVDVHTAPLSIDGALQVHGQLTQPLAAPLSLALTASPTKTPGLDAQVQLHLGDSQLDARLGWPTLAAQVKTLRLAPETVKPFVPAWPLVVPLELHGALSETAANLALEAGPAKARVTGSYSVPQRTIDALVLDAEVLDPSTFTAALHPSRLGLHLEARLTDAKVATLTGALQAHGQWKTPDGRPLATLEAQAEARHGEVRAAPVTLVLPGISVRAHGSGTASGLEVESAVEASDLSLLPRFLDDVLGLALPPLAGKGSLTVSAKGPLLHPALAVRGALSGLRYDTLRAGTLSLEASLPDVRHPLDTDGTVTATQLQLGERTFSQVHAQVRTQGRALSAELTAQGLGDLRGTLAGVLDPGSEGLALTDLQVSSAEGSWKLEAPVHLAWAGRTLLLEPCALRSGPQRLTLRARKQGPRLDAAVTLEQVDLARLPRLASPPALGLQGLVSGEVTVKGLLPWPEAQVHLSARQVTVKPATGLDADVSATLHEGVAVGTVKLAAPVGALSGPFSVPVEAWLAHRAAPVTATLSLARVDLEQAAQLAGQPPQARGVLEGQLEVSGTTLEPRAALTLAVPELSVALPERDARLVLEHVNLTVQPDTDGALGATLSTSALHGVVEAKLQTPWSLDSLLAHVPALAEVEAAKLSASISAQGLSLASARELGLTDDETLAGVASLQATLEGPWRAPTGEVTVSLQRGHLAALAGLDATLTVKAQAHETTLRGHGELQGAPLFTLEGTLGAPVKKLLHPEQLEAEEVKLHAVVLPLELAQVLSTDEGPTAKGQLGATLDVDGRLDDPRVRLLGSVQGLTFTRASLGSARFTWNLDHRHHAWVLALGGLGANDLKARGTLDLDVSPRALRQGLAWREAPVSATLEARKLDLGFLSGVHTLVRVVEGQLTLGGTVAGTLGAPRFDVTAGWEQGHLGLMGFGDFRDIAIGVKASNERLELPTCTLRSGGGTLQLDALALHQPSGAWSLTAHSRSQRFPLINDDQLMALLSEQVELEGSLSDELIDLSHVAFTRLEVELPEVKRKNIQDLNRPVDIIVLRGGETAKKRQREAARKGGAVAAPVSTRLVRAEVSAANNVWVRGSDLNLELGLSEGFHVEVAQAAQMFGELRVLRGRLSVIGRQFDLEPGSTVRFAGPAALPYVTVTATYLNDREKVKVTVAVTGRGSDVALKLSSDPAMTESDIYTLLATGRRNLRVGGGTSMTPEQAVSVVGSLAASQLKTALAKQVPLDVLSIDTGSEGLTSTRVEVGKYLSDSVYLGVTAQPGANTARGENPWAGRLELQMSKSWSLQATAGTAPAVGGDVVWSRDF
jgi:translocation and assembly module TamB